MAAQEVEKKRFVCYWDEGYNFGKGAAEIHEEDWFTEDRGYEKEHRDRILALEVGGIAKFLSPTADHWVIRVR